MAENQVKIVISAEDKATATMNKVAQSFKQYQSSYESIGQFTAHQKTEADALAASQKNLAKSTDTVADANKGLFTTFTAATLAAEGIMRLFGFVQNQIGESVQAARDYNAAMTGLSAATTSYGESAAMATQQAQALSVDGILPITNSAKALQNLMAGGLGLEQSTDLIQTFMDRAAFGRNRTIDFGTAVENLTQAFRTEQSELSDASGMTENYSQILELGANQLGKNVEQLNQAERAQAKFVGIQQLSAAQAGNYARYLETDAAAQDRFNYQIEETQRLLGAAIQPAVALSQQGFGSLIQSLGITDANMQQVQASVVTLVAVAQTAGNILLGVGQTIVGMFQSLFTLSLDPFEDAAQQSADRIINTSMDWQRSMDKIAAGTADTQIDESQRAATGIVDATTKATRDMLRDIDEANRQFARSQEQRLMQFQDSLKDMVIAHRDKSLSIKADLAAEDAAYAASAKKREQEYGDDIAQLEERHAEKVEDITKKITEEREWGIVVDGRLYANANQEKLDELDEELRGETAKHDQAMAKRKAQYAADVAENQGRYDAKRSQLETELSSELEILNKHRADVAAVGDAQKEDDITRLKNQFATANQEVERNHQEQLTKIRQRAAEQGATAGSSYTGGALGAINQGKGALTHTMGDMGAEMGRRFADSLKQGMDERSHRFDFTGWMNGIFHKMGDAFDKVKSWYRNTDWAKTIDSATNWQAGAAQGVAKFFGLDPNAASRLLTGRASGGPVRAGQPYIVGEREPELFVPNQSGRILNQEQLQRAMTTSSGNGTSAGLTVNIKEQHFHSNLDQTSFLRQLYWEGRR